MIRKTHLSLIFLSLLAVACPGETGGSGSAGGGTVPAPGSAGSGSFVVIFDGQSAMNDPNPNFKVVNSPAITVDALPTPPTKPHVTFGGWFTAKNGGGTQFTASSNVSGNMTVYAKWDPILTVKIGNLLWKKCSEGQRNDGVCTGTAVKYQHCGSSLDHVNCGDPSFPSIVTTGQAFDRCNALNSNPAGGFAGKINWRLPTPTELQTLANSFPNTNFPNTASGLYWSNQWSTGITSIGGVGFFYGVMNDPEWYTINQPTDFFYVRCVSEEI